MADTPPKFTYTSVPTCPNCRAKLPELATLCKRCGQVMLRLHYQPKQRLVRDLLMTRGPESPTRIGFGGSRGSSKSRLGRDVALEVALTIAMSHAGVLVYIIARNLGNLEDNYIKKYRIERPDIMEYYRASPRPEFNLPNGATVAFRYADNPEDMTRLERGPEAFLIIVEQAEQFTEKELQQITKPNRWPNAPLGACKTLFLFNPGGPGTQFLQRVFYLKQYEGTERPSDFAFVQAFSWDNWAWFEQECREVPAAWVCSKCKTDCRYPALHPALHCGCDCHDKTVELTEEQFYALPGDIPPCAGEYNDAWLDTVPDTHRFKIFVTRTSEGRKYWALPESMRMGDLFGRFDQFAGQYFAGVWDQRLCVLPTRIVDSLAQYWWTCWMGGDLGFGHSSAIFWACTGKISPSIAWELLHIDTEWPLDIVIVYRELVPPMRTAEADLGRLIVDATPQEAERHALRKFVMGSDTKTVDRYSMHSRRELIDAVTVPTGFPAIRSAQDQPGSRVINARLMYEMLRRTSSMRSENPPRDRPDDKVAPCLFISVECPQLIGAIPLLITDEDQPDDVLKLETVADDVFDGCLIGSTLVQTEHGEIPLESIRPGMRVRTRSGLRKVLRSWMTRTNAPTVTVHFSNGSRIQGTPDHPIWSNGQFLSLDSLRYGDIIEAWSSSTSKEESIANCPRAIIGRPNAFCTATFGHLSMAPFQGSTTSITAMETIKTTIFKTWNAFTDQITSRLTTRERKSQMDSLLDSSNNLKPGMHPQKVGSGTVSMGLLLASRAAISALKSLVRSVARYVLKTRETRIPFAEVSVAHDGGARAVEMIWTKFVTYAVECFARANTRRQLHVPVSVERLTPAQNENVYNLEVEDCHEFYANGILVHNCKYTLAEYLAVQLIAPREVRKAEYVQRGASLTQQYINALKFDEDDAQNEKRGRKH